MIKIINQYLKSLDFSVPASPKFFIVEKNGTPDTEIAVEIDAKKINRKNDKQKLTENTKTDELFEITLNLKVTAKVAFDGKEKEQLFNLNTSYSGLFMINADDEEDLNNILSIYCPTILFPFARRIVATTTGDAGLPPLMLDPIDFSKVQKQQKNN